MCRKKEYRDKGSEKLMLTFPYKRSCCERGKCDSTDRIHMVGNLSVEELFNLWKGKGQLNNSTIPYYCFNTDWKAKLRFEPYNL